MPLLLLTILLLQAQKFILGRRGYSVVGGKYGAPRRVEMKKWRWAALAFCLVMLLNPVFLPYLALAERRILIERDDAGDAVDVDGA